MTVSTNEILGPLGIGRTLCVEGSKACTVSSLRIFTVGCRSPMILSAILGPPNVHKEPYGLYSMVLRVSYRVVGGAAFAVAGLPCRCAWGQKLKSNDI